MLIKGIANRGKPIFGWCADAERYVRVFRHCRPTKRNGIEFHSDCERIRELGLFRLGQDLAKSRKPKVSRLRRSNGTVTGVTYRQKKTPPTV
jgi:hypothetical protein